MTGRGGRRGFTLIETLIAMCLTVILMAALAAALMTGSNALTRIKRSSQAATLGDTVITKICALVGFADSAQSLDGGTVLRFHNPNSDEYAEIYTDGGKLRIRYDNGDDLSILSGDAYLSYAARLDGVSVDTDGIITARVSVYAGADMIHEREFWYDPGLG